MIRGTSSLSRTHSHIFNRAGLKAPSTDEQAHNHILRWNDQDPQPNLQMVRTHIHIFRWAGLTTTRLRATSTDDQWSPTHNYIFRWAGLTNTSSDGLQVWQAHLQTCRTLRNVSRWARLTAPSSYDHWPWLTATSLDEQDSQPHL
jgi:hypothetical protein